MNPKILSIPNALAVGSDGWAQLAPFGDHPGVAWVNGQPRPAIQRVDAEAGRVIKEALHGWIGKALRFFNDVPLYHGHPDVPAIAARYPDAERKGSITDLEVRPDGIYVRLALTNDGQALLHATTGIGLSAYVDAQAIGQDGDTVIARWSRLRSVGLTDKPNLPVQLINESIDMTPQLIATLNASGITLANDASPEQVQQAIGTLARQRDDALTLANQRATQLATLTTERDQFLSGRDQAKAELANERTARIKEALDHAVESGRIAEADRGTWEPRLTANFANESAALAKLKPQWKVAQQTEADGKRVANQSSAVQLINTAVAEIQKEDSSLTFQQAFLRAAEKKPELFR